VAAKQDMFNGGKTRHSVKTQFLKTPSQSIKTLLLVAAQYDTSTERSNSHLSTTRQQESDEIAQTPL
jgi:hypothetical protein